MFVNAAREVMLDLPAWGRFRLACKLAFTKNAHYIYSMNRVLKTFFLWLLIATLPLQGIAAAMKASCGPGHHATALLNDAVDNHHHDGQAAADHHPDRTAISALENLSSDMPDASSARQLESSFCSSCASCCFGAIAPPPISLQTPIYSSSEFIVVTAPPLVTGFIPAGLERPPKPVSA